MVVFLDLRHAIVIIHIILLLMSDLWCSDRKWCHDCVMFLSYIFQMLHQSKFPVVSSLYWDADSPDCMICLNGIFQMLNYSKFPIVFHWSSLKDSHIIEVQTPEGQIPPESSVELEMTIIGGHPGHIDHTLHCVIDHQESTVPLRVVADVKVNEQLMKSISI